MSTVVSVRSSLRALIASVAVIAGVGAQVVQASPAAADVLPSLSAITAPSDISATGPFSIGGHVDNTDLSPSTSLRLRVDLNSSALTSAVDAGMLQGTCDVGATTGVALAFSDPSVGLVTVSCPTVFTVPASGSVAFTMSLGLTAPSDTTGTLATTIRVVADSTSEELTSSSAPPISVHHAPVLTVTPPTSADDSPTAFSGTLDNTGGIAGTDRLDISVTDGTGMGSVTPAQIPLDCAVTPQGGPAGTSQPVTLTGASVAQGLTGSCPAGAGYPLAADEFDTFGFHISFDQAVPSTGAVKLTFALVTLDGGGAPLAPALVATSPATVVVFPPPTATTSPPSVLATGATPKSYSGSIDDPANGRDYPNIWMGLRLSGIATLSAGQVHMSCDGGSTAVTLTGTGTLTGQCRPAAGPSAGRGDTLPQTFQLCIDGGAPTGALSVATSILDGDHANAVLSSEPAHNVNVIAGKNGAGLCPADGVTLVWTGPSGGDWTDPANWDGGAVPGIDDTAVVPPSSSITNVHGGVANLVIDGGSDGGSAAALAIVGSLEVAAEADVSGHAVLTDEPGASPAPGLTVNALLATASGTDIELGNDANIVVPQTATATFGSSTKLHRPASLPVTGSVPAVELGGTVQPAGTVTLDQVGLQVAGGG